MILSFELLLHFMILCLCSCFSPKIPICYFLPTIFPLLAISTLKTSFLVHVPSAPRSCPAFQSHSKWILFCILISVLLDTICLDFCIIVISFVFSTLRFYIYIYIKSGWNMKLLLFNYFWALNIRSSCGWTSFFNIECTHFWK